MAQLNIPTPPIGAPFPLGGVYLDNVRFTTNPKTYKPVQWKKRYSIQDAIGGKVTIQDFGTFAKDCEVVLASEDKQFLDEPTTITIHEKFRIRGATFELRDWMLNNFTIFMMEFEPINFRPNIYLYNAKFKVVAINTLWGVTYVGT